MQRSSPNRYLYSKLAYSFLTLSPFHTALTLFLAVLSVVGYLDKASICIKADFRMIAFWCALAIVPPLTWGYYAVRRWIPSRVSIPKTAKRNIPEHLDGCVELIADSLMNASGCPVLSYNTNNYIGGRRLGTQHEPNLMAQWLNYRFSGTAHDPLSFDFDLFLSRYNDSRTLLISPEGKELNKADFVTPRRYTPGMAAAAGDKPDLPKGAVIALHLPQQAETTNAAKYAFLLCNTWVKVGDIRPESDIGTLETCLRTLWPVTDRVLANMSCAVCFPTLGCGYAGMAGGTFSSIWALVVTYRIAYQYNKPDHELHLYIPPQEIREFDLREILKLMTYALCA